MAAKCADVIPAKEAGFSDIIKPLSLKQEEGGYHIVLNRKRQQRKT